VAGFFWLISLIAGPVLGFVLIFANVSLTWVNVVGSLVFALLVPYVAIGRTLLYLDLSARAEQKAAIRAGDRAAGCGRGRAASSDLQRAAERTRSPRGA
jgi:hypothetical protein